MAKISAYGDSELARWRRTPTSRRSAPYEMLLTSKGRLLYKAHRGEGWTFRRGGVGIGHANAQAAAFFMERV